VVVAQGWEAGGHNYGGLPTLALVPTVVDAVAPALVLAAGGIADGRGAAAALALGADGVWAGSRLVATQEAAVHAEHKTRIVAASGEQTVRSSIFGPEWPHFNPMRVIRNRVVEEWNDRLSEVPTQGDELPRGANACFGLILPWGTDRGARRVGACADRIEPKLRGCGTGLGPAIVPAAVVWRRTPDLSTTLSNGATPVHSIIHARSANGLADFGGAHDRVDAYPGNLVLRQSRGLRRGLPANEASSARWRRCSRANGLRSTRRCAAKYMARISCLSGSSANTHDLDLCLPSTEPRLPDWVSDHPHCHGGGVTDHSTRSLPVCFMVGQPLRRRLAGKQARSAAKSSRLR
jgi:hypothetical protein